MAMGDAKPSVLIPMPSRDRDRGLLVPPAAVATASASSGAGADSDDDESKPSSASSAAAAAAAQTGREALHKVVHSWASKKFMTGCGGERGAWHPPNLLLIGKPLVFSLWPDKLRFFQKQVAKRREKLLNYMFFLRVTPTLPNTFINLASPIVDVPYHIFFLATLVGLIPTAYVTVRAGIALGDLSSLSDLYDPQSIALLFLIGVVSVTPTLLGKNETQGNASEMAASSSTS